MRCILFLILITISCRLFAQFPKPEYQGIAIGLSNTKILNNDSDKFEKSVLPYLGIFYTRELSKSFNLSISANYAGRGSNVLTPYRRYRFQYLNLELCPSFHLTDYLNLHGGVLGSSVFSSVLYTSAGSREMFRIPIKKYSIESYLTAGISAEFQKGVLAALNYDYPLNARFSSIRFGLSFVIDPARLSEKFSSGKNLAYDRIEEMKNGILLVRLQSGRTPKEALLKTGQADKAEELERTYLNLNIEIIRGFRRQFNFCPVYFFYAENTEKLKRGEIDGIFLNDSLKAEPGIVPALKTFFVAEFGTFSPEMNQGNDLIGDFSINSGIDALYVMDKNFKILPYPFPSSVRTVELGNTKAPAMAIMELNYQFHDFYKKSQSEKKK